ncbi:hypothetical protein MRB53_041420 [Persea americana]|nr:hypothetical protein MRB53_041420 [Persea americana]
MHAALLQSGSVFSANFRVMLIFSTSSDQDKTRSLPSISQCRCSRRSSALSFDSCMSSGRHFCSPTQDASRQSSTSLREGDVIT